MTAAAVAPAPELVLRLLSGLADSSDLTREQVLQAVGTYFVLSAGKEGSTARAALAQADRLVGGMVVGRRGVRCRYWLMPWGPLMETAVRVWAVASAVPDATRAHVHDVVIGNASLTWWPPVGWELSAGELVADVADADEDVGYEVPARVQSCADCGDLTDGHLCPMCRGVVDVG